MLDVKTEQVIITNKAKYPKRIENITIQPGQAHGYPLEIALQVASDPDLLLDFTPMRDHFRSRTADGRPMMDLTAPLTVVDGYGRHALSIFEGLRRIGVEVRLRRTPNFRDDSTHLPTE